MTPNPTIRVFSKAPVGASVGWGADGGVVGAGVGELTIASTLQSKLKEFEGPEVPQELIAFTVQV